VPWYLIPFNVIFVIYLIIVFLSEAQGKKAKKYLKEQTGSDTYSSNDLTTGDHRGLKILISCRPELDFPLDYIPPSVISCGPIVRAVRTVKDSDPELAAWLARGPTILINLGSHCWAEPHHAIEMASAIRQLFDTEQETRGRRELRVLWKLKQVPEVEQPATRHLQEYSVDKPGDGVYDLIGGEMDDDRVRIVSWLAAEPYAVQQTGHVVCNINHGGANSFWEAVVCGVPQVVLPVWADTYDFAHRAERFGVGVWGSRKAAPRYAAAELGPALVEVVCGPQAESMRTRAKEWAKRCADWGEGRDIAAKTLLEEMSALEAR
jgi:hypothetical protein